MAGYTVDERGSRNSLEYRMFIKDGSGKPVSPMHDIPMLAGRFLYLNADSGNVYFQAMVFTTWWWRFPAGPMQR